MRNFLTCIFLLFGIASPAFSQLPKMGGVEVLPESIRLSLMSFIDKIPDETNFSVTHARYYEEENIAIVSLSSEAAEIVGSSNCLETLATLSYTSDIWIFTDPAWLYWHDVGGCENLNRDNAILLNNLIDSRTLSKIISEASLIIELGNDPNLQKRKYRKFPLDCKIAQMGIGKNKTQGFVYGIRFDQPCNSSISFEITENGYEVLEVVSPAIMY